MQQSALKKNSGAMDDFRLAMASDLAVMSRLLAAEMDRPMIEWMRVSRFPTGFGLDSGDETQGAVLALRAAVAGLPQVGGRESRSELSLDYAQLFLNPAMPLLATESYWHAVGQRRADVENWYERYGFKISDRHQRPADSLTFELAFLVHLLEDVPGRAAVETARRFWKTHPLSWALRFLPEMSRIARSHFYRALGNYLLVYFPALDAAWDKVEGDIMSVPA